MSTPSTALEGLATRPAAAPALKIVPARHPLQVVGTLLALALILIGLQSVLGNPRWGWGTFAEWFFAKPVLEGQGRTLLQTAPGAEPDVVLVFVSELVAEAKAALPDIERRGGTWVDAGAGR